MIYLFFFFSSRRRHTRFDCDWSSDVCSSDLESVALLTTYVQGAEFERHEHRNIGNGALTAIALHADASADRAMDSFVKPDQRDELRKQAAFWLGADRKSVV